MNKRFRNNIILLIMLILSAIAFIALDAYIDIENRNVNAVFFLIASLIVTMTVYILLRIIIEKFPGFLQKGFWANPFTILFAGALVFIVFVFIFVWGSNNLQQNPMMNKIITFAIAYPVSFVFILMVDAFYEFILHINRGKRLLISTISIILALVVMVLFRVFGFA